MLDLADGSTILGQELVRLLFMEDVEQMETTSEQGLIVKSNAVVSSLKYYNLTLGCFF